MCAYICVYVDMYTHLCIYICVCEYICMFMYICVCMHIYVYIKYMGVFIYTYLHVLKLVNLTNSVFFFFTL